jgi:hypothetical protein
MSGPRPRDRSARTGLSVRAASSIIRVILTLLFVALTALPVIDLSGARDPRLHAEDPKGWWAFFGPHYPGDDFPAVIATLPKVGDLNSHYLAITTAWAARDAANGPVGVVLVPPNLGTFLDRKGDESFGGHPAHITEGYLMWYTGGRYRAAAYQAVLSDERVAELDSDPALAEYPWDVWAIVDGDRHETVALYTDPQRTRLFVLPMEGPP